LHRVLVVVSAINAVKILVVTREQVKDRVHRAIAVIVEGAVIFAPIKFLSLFLKTKSNRDLCLV